MEQVERTEFILGVHLNLGQGLGLGRANSILRGPEHSASRKWQNKVNSEGLGLTSGVLPLNGHLPPSCVCTDTERQENNEGLEPNSHLLALGRDIRYSLDDE